MKTLSEGSGIIVTDRSGRQLLSTFAPRSAGRAAPEYLNKPVITKELYEALGIHHVSS
jgi:hypothetical protein